MIAVIDYEMGNLRSVSKALELFGARVCVTSDRGEIKKAEGLVLPGVGAFIQAMGNLKRLDLASVICDALRENKPFLGICLGMQLLFTESEEGGECKGLGIIKGRVRRFEGGGLKIPHMGWNNVKFKSQNEKYKIFEGIPDNSYMYFVHSYYAQPEDESLILATAEYGIEFAAAIAKENIYATQFHPEKSHTLGLKILENFCKKIVSSSK